jgi:hypothetical protein
MGFLNAMRDMMREHGRVGLNSIRDLGKMVAPGLTKRASKFVHRNSRLLGAIGQAGEQAFNVADAATVGDLAGGLHAGVHLGQSVAGVVKMAQRGASRKRRRTDIPSKLQTKRKRIGNDTAGGSALEQFDSGAANDPKISGDLMARMTKSVRGF